VLADELEGFRYLASELVTSTGGNVDAGPRVRNRLLTRHSRQHGTGSPLFDGHAATPLSGEDRRSPGSGRAPDAGKSSHTITFETSQASSQPEER